MEIWGARTTGNKTGTLYKQTKTEINSSDSDQDACQEGKFGVQ